VFIHGYKNEKPGLKETDGKIVRFREARLGKTSLSKRAKNRQPFFGAANARYKLL
jgi:hypothetical protein